ncbi:MAG TPA: trypsin-like peptidase domain-containing protein [Polyangiaceae bacterium]|nr:trypsin-like peptidase domain-containing protein [Polyangiaceae bacterium]
MARWLRRGLVCASFPLACQGRGTDTPPPGAEPVPSSLTSSLPSTPSPVAPAPVAPAPAAPPPAPAPPVPPSGVSALGPGAKIEDERNSISVFEAVAPATVFVTNKRTVIDPFRRAVEVPTGTGSGFIWDAQGHIVTNYHVIKGAESGSVSLSVTLFDHRTFDARVVGFDDRKDIAVLRMEDAPENLHPIRVERGLELVVGQKTLAIGNPFGLDQTLTTGVVSALGRSVPGDRGVTIRDMVQTDAAINPGNSGGPLLDSSGRLIGMNTMIFSRSGSSAGIGFAVPVSSIARIVPQLIKSGKSDQIGIGVVVDPDQKLERTYGVRGVLVLRVSETGPAAKAGLRGTTLTRRGIAFGDVITGIGNDPVNDYDDLYTILDRHQPGDKVKLSIVRGDQRMQVEVDLVLLP